MGKEKKRARVDQMGTLIMISDIGQDHSAVLPNASLVKAVKVMIQICHYCQ